MEIDHNNSDNIPTTYVYTTIPNKSHKGSSMSNRQIEQSKLRSNQINTYRKYASTIVPVASAYRTGFGKNKYLNTKKRRKRRKRSKKSKKNEMKTRSTNRSIK
jgi:hypothetical protein